MVSSVKEYKELYSKFENVLSQSEEYKNSLEQLEEQSQKLKHHQQQFDYTDANVVIQNMENHIDDEVKNKKAVLQKEVRMQMGKLGNTNDKINKNFAKAIKWLTKKKADKLVSQSEPDFSQGFIPC